MKRRLFDRIISFIRVGFFGWKSQFDLDIKDSRRFLWSIKEPNEDCSRSYAQYRCQCYLRRKGATLLLNMGCALAILPYIVKCLFGKVNEKGSKDIVYTISVKDDRIIPSSLRSEYPNCVITNEYDGTCLNKKDLQFIWRVFKKYPFSFFFLLRIVIKVSFYSYFIEEYHPKAIAINSEYSCTSSVMTLYCERRGIKHINIMHGEKLFFIRDSFFRFSRCYVWDTFYADLFIKLRAFNNQFIVEKPKALTFGIEEFKGKLPHVDFKYMLNGNDKLGGIAHILHELKQKGYRTMVRPHPAYTNKDLLANYFERDEIESCSVPIEMSLSNTENVISLYSTVLLQAYFSGINIVLDDINYAIEYNKLKDLEYILINKQHSRLSQII